MSGPGADDVSRLPALQSNTGADSYEAAVALLLHRERARHHTEWVTTGHQLRGAASSSHEPLVIQLRKDLSWAGAAIIRALDAIEDVESGAQPECAVGQAVDQANPALVAATSALRSALACHLSLEAHRRAARDQVG